MEIYCSDYLSVVVFWYSKKEFDIVKQYSENSLQFAKHFKIKKAIPYDFLPRHAEPERALRREVLREPRRRCAGLFLYIVLQSDESIVVLLSGVLGGLGGVSGRLL